MEEYVQEALQQKYIGPSTSSALAGFFFVEKNIRGFMFTAAEAFLKSKKYSPLLPYSMLQNLSYWRLMLKRVVLETYCDSDSHMNPHYTRIGNELRHSQV